MEHRLTPWKPDHLVCYQNLSGQPDTIPISEVWDQLPIIFAATITAVDRLLLDLMEEHNG